MLAGPIVDHLSYHCLFWLPLVPLVAATVAIHLFVPESPVRVPGRVNWTGAALMSVGLGARADRGQRDARPGTGSRRRRSADRGSASSLLVAWVRSESRSDQPLVDMRMMRIRGVWTTNAVALLLGFGMYASFILLPQYVETPSRAGLRLRRLGHAAPACSCVPSTLAMLVVGAQTGRLERRFGSKPPLLAGALVTRARRTCSSPSPATSAGRSTSPRCSSAPASASRSRRWST